MTGTVFLNTTTLSAFKAITGVELPSVSAKLQAALTLTVKFFATGEEAALLTGSPTFRVTLKGTPTGSPFVFSSSATATSDGYTFTFTSVDSAALRTAIGDLTELDAFGEVEWTIASVVERVAFPVTIVNAYLRTDDDAPDPVAEDSDTWLTARAVRFDAAQTLTAAQAAQALANQKVTITSGGYLRVVSNAGDVFYASLNSGEPPA